MPPHRCALPLFLLALLVATGGGSGACAPPRVDVGDNTIVRSNYDFVPEHWQEPRLKALRDQEHLDLLEREDAFATLLALVAWTHRQWPHSKPRPPPPDNAIDILREIRAGKTGGWCGQYSFVLVDIAKALGFFCARYVEISSVPPNPHFVSEIWSDRHGKWVVLDADFGTYLRRAVDGQPASALEVRDAVLGGAAVEPVTVHGGPLQVAGGALADPQEYVGLYHDVAVSLQSDRMRSTSPSSVTQRRQSYLSYNDGRGRGPAGTKNLFSNVTSRRQDLEFDCNKVRVEWELLQRDRGQLNLRSDGATPNFRRFVCARGSTGSPDAVPREGWEPCAAPLVVERRNGDQILWLATENQLGRRGVPHRVRIAW